MAQPLNTTKTFLATSKSAGKVLGSSSAFVVIEGFEELTFALATNSMPMLKNSIIEYAISTGTKTSDVGKTQTAVDLPVTFNERDTHLVKKTIENIIMGGKNGQLKVSFYTGDIDQLNTKLWGTVSYAKFITEDMVDSDAEGSESPMKISCRIVGHYFPDECAVDLVTRGIAATAINKALEYTAYSEC